MAHIRDSHSWNVLSQWDKLVDRSQPGVKNVLDGKHLDISTVVAVARLVFPRYIPQYLQHSRDGSGVALDETVIPNLEESAKAVQESLDKGEIIYGTTNSDASSWKTNDVQV